MKLVLSIAMPMVVLLALIASAWYVALRLAALLGVERTRFLSVTWAIITALASAGGFMLATSPSPLVGALYIASGLVFIAHLYLCFALLILHGVHRFFRLNNYVQAWGAITVALGFTALGVWQSGRLAVETREVPVAGLDHALTVMHISDVHLGHHRGRAFLGRVVDETNRRHPDLVLITGDLVDGNIALDSHVLEPLTAFNAPVYFVTGNHESYVDTDRALALIAEQGVRILHNERVDVHGIQIVGLDYMNADEDTFDMHPVGDRTIREELPRIPVADDRPLLVMHHSPVGLEYVADRGTALMLAGHTHAGQVFPGTVFAPLIFRLNQGLYDYEGMQVFVSQGAGTLGPRMRLGSANTIHALRLVPQ